MYTVQSGDTLSGIAAKYGMTVNELAQLNGISDPNRIQVGQVLKVYGESNGGSSSRPTTTYVVQSGDTLSGIAAKYGMTVNELAQLNGISDPNRIQVGQVLKVYGSNNGNNNHQNNGNTTPSSGNMTTHGGKYVTGDQLIQIGWQNVNQAMVDDLNNCLERFQITTKLRICHFISQCSEESGAGLYREELASGEEYEGRSDLGNIYPGDGVKYKGAGYIQLTGRANYQKLADFMHDNNIMTQGASYVAQKYP